MLVRQFRLPAFVNEHPDGHLWEAPHRIAGRKRSGTGDSARGREVARSRGREDIEVVELPFADARRIAGLATRPPPP